MKMAFLQNTNISETKKGAKKKCINGMQQMAQRSPVQKLGINVHSGVRYGCESRDGEIHFIPK